MFASLLAALSKVFLFRAPPHWCTAKDVRHMLSALPADQCA
jgi:hypothetical protein